MTWPDVQVLPSSWLRRRVRFSRFRLAGLQKRMAPGVLSFGHTARNMLAWQTGSISTSSDFTDDQVTPPSELVATARRFFWWYDRILCSNRPSASSTIVDSLVFSSSL